MVKIKLFTFLYSLQHQFTRILPGLDETKEWHRNNADVRTLRISGSTRAPKLKRGNQIYRKFNITLDLVLGTGNLL